MQNQTPTNSGKTLIISNRLPVKIERKKGKLKFTASEGGLATGLGSFYKDNGSWWIGWPGIIPKTEEEEQHIREELYKLNLIPVFLTQTEIKNYYEGFSNAVLWPLCHYRPSYVELRDDYWAAYEQVNQKFAKASLPYIEEETTVWVHDYQLMLLPKYIREQSQPSSIGYFHHIPFPPPELFSMLPWRKQLLDGLSSADLVGFHTYENAHNFLEANQTLLNAEIHHHHIKLEGRSCFVDVFPMGIDYEKYKRQAIDKKTQLYAAELKKLFEDKKIILSVDRLDYSKGILQRLASYEKLLLKYPELQEKVVLYMLIVPSRDQVNQYKKLRNEIDRKVGNINAVLGSPGWQPVSYFYKSLPFDKLSAVYAAADVCLVSSLYDGMNLVAKEYIASKQLQTGALVLSEFAGASKELSDALLINPYAIEESSDILYEALMMSESEKQERMQASQQVVEKFNVFHWVNLFFQRLREIKEQQNKAITRKVKDQVRTSIKSTYKQATNRLILLDYDGTLVGFNKDAAKATPTAELHQLLENIANDKQNTLSLVSGRKYDNMQDWFPGKSFFTIAEHGIWSNFPNHQWHIKEGLSNEWKVFVRSILQRFTDRTPGSLIEEKTYSLAWHYRKVDHALGKIKAQELLQELHPLANEIGLQIINGDRVIEIKNMEINKGKAVVQLVNEINPDYILCIGDDATDEDMFNELPANAVTIKVGNKQSAAKYFVENKEEVLQLLTELTQS